MKNGLVFLTFEDIVDIFLTFKSAFQKEEYTAFCESRIATSSKWGVLILYGVIYLTEILMGLKAEISSAVLIAILLYCCLARLSAMVLWANNENPSAVKFLESLLLLGICVEGGLLFLVNDTTQNNVAREIHTNSVSLMSSHDLVLLTMSPLLLSIVFHSTEWFTTFCCWMNGIGFMLFRSWSDFNANSCLSVAMYILMSLAISYEYRRQSLSKFLLAQNLKLLIQENERMADEFHANEMRHMIANVAHDLKTPLAGFMNGNEIVANVLTDCAEKHKQGVLTAEYIHESAVSLMACVNNMKSINNFMLMTINRCIDYTKASQGLKLVPHRETIDLQEALSLPVSVMKDMQSKISIVLRQMSPDICSHVITDKQWLQENILCLLSNAMKYSSGGEVHVTLELLTDTALAAGRKVQESHHRPSRAFSEQVEALLSPNSMRGSPCGVTFKRDGLNQHVEHLFAETPAVDEPEENMLLLIEVEDHGIGLSEEVMETLFNPFRQAQRMTGGTGLGLYSLAKRLDALGGYYGVLKRRDGGQGSRFWFAIPYRPDVDSANSARLAALRFTETPTESADHSPQLSQHTPRRSSQAAFKTEQEDKLSVLLVDDSVSVIKLTGMMLRRQGYSVSTAENGAVAVNKVLAANSSGEPYDVVLMDLQMPVMDGLEAMRRIRETETINHSAHQLIIGVSANSDHDTMEAALAAGADAFINKPFTTKIFCEAVAKLKSPGIVSSSSRSRLHSDATASSSADSNTSSSKTVTASSSPPPLLPPLGCERIADGAAAVFEVPVTVADIGKLFSSAPPAKVAPVFLNLSSSTVGGVEVPAQTIRRCKTRRFAVMEVCVATHCTEFEVLDLGDVEK